jgi:hypothetical protein
MPGFTPFFSPVYTTYLCPLVFGLTLFGLFISGFTPFFFTSLHRLFMSSGVRINAC